jgi:serine/threonine protein kinase
MFFVVNEIIDEVYEILKVHDSHKNVWFARNNQDGKTIVIKVKDIPAKDFKSMLMDECEAIIKLNKHNNLAQCYWVKIIHDRICIAYEYIDGSNLKEYWERDSKFNNYEVILSIILQLIESVSFIKKNGYILHDITPENIYVIHKKGSLPIIKLIDFDAIIKIGKEGHLDNQKIGQFKYIPVESFPCSSNEDPNINLSIDNVTYSIAFIFYQMISNSHRTPFEELEHDYLTMENWFLLHRNIETMFKDDPDLIPFDKLFHKKLQNKNNKNDNKNHALQVIYYLIEGCCKKKSERIRFDDLKDLLIERVIEEYLFDTFSKAFKEYIIGLRNIDNNFPLVHSDDLNNKGVSMINLSKYVAEKDIQRSKEYGNEAKKYFQLAIQKNCKHFESRINLILLNCEEDALNYNILDELNDLILDYQRHEIYSDFTVYGIYLLSYYSLLNGDIRNASEYIVKAIKDIKKLKGPLKIGEDNFHFIRKIIEYIEHKKREPLELSYYKKENQIYGERIERLLQTSLEYRKEIGNWQYYCNDSYLYELINSIDVIDFTSIKRYGKEKSFSYACFSPSLNNDSQIILAIDKEGKIHRLIERRYYEDNKGISYFENVYLKSKSDRIFTHITSSFDSQIILAIDKEGKITLWNKHDYDDEYYENSQLAKIFNERGQTFTYACFSPSTINNDSQIILAIDKEGKITLWNKHDYDDEYYENSQLAKIFNEREQTFTYACFSPSDQKKYIVTEIKDKKELVLWKVDTNNKDIECKHIFHLDSISFIGCTSFSSDSNILICLNEGMLYRLSIQNVEDSKISKLIHFDNYFFSHSTRSLDEEIESTNNIKNIKSDISNDISNHLYKKASDNYYKIITKYSNYVIFDEIKEIILKSRSSYKDLSDIDEICKIIDFSNKVKLEKYMNENSTENKLFCLQSGIYLLKIRISNIIHNIIDIYLEDNVTNRIISQFQRFSLSLYQISVTPSGYFFIINKKNMEIHNLPIGLSEKLLGKVISGIYLSNNKSFAVVITLNGEIFCYTKKGDKFKKQFHDSFEEKSFIDLCFNKDESVFMASTTTGDVFIYRMDGYLVKKIINLDKEPIINAFFSSDSYDILIFSKSKIKVFTLKWKPKF